MIFLITWAISSLITKSALLSADVELLLIRTNFLSINSAAGYTINDVPTIYTEHHKKHHSPYNSFLKQNYVTHRLL